MTCTATNIILYASFLICCMPSLMAYEEIDLDLLSKQRSSDFQFRIIGGEATSIGKYPFMVSVQLSPHPTDPKTMFPSAHSSVYASLYAAAPPPSSEPHYAHACGGALYTTDLVITAAHCCFHFEPYKTRREYVKLKVGEMSVLMGSDSPVAEKYPAQEVRRAVISLEPHMHFNFTTMENDIAILKLSVPVVLTSKIQLVPIHFEVPPAPVKKGIQCTAVGWGHQMMKFPDVPPHGIKPSDSLQHVVLEVTDEHYCGKFYDLPLGQKVCTHTPDRDVCMGDSGGPLLCNEKMVALTSYAKGCAYKDLPSVFQRLDVQMEWIVDTEIRIMSEANYTKTRSNFWIFIYVIISLHTLLL